MSDPLSVAAGVAGLVAIAIQTTQYFVDYYSSYRERDKQLVRTILKLDELLQSFRIIDDIVQKRKFNADEQTVLSHIESSMLQCESIIRELETEANKFRIDTGSSDTSNKLKFAGRKVLYPFRQSTLEKLNEDVDDLRSNLSVALDALQLKDHQNVQDEVTELRTILETIQARQLNGRLCSWLKAPDATTDYNAACHKRQPGTGLWFVNGTSFQSWLEEQNAFLWLNGFAGCGKSVLCSTAIQHTFRRKLGEQGAAMAFFFFTFTDSSKQDASAMLRALLLQLSGQIAELEVDLSRLQERYSTGTPPISTLMAHLRQAILRSEKTFLLLDALDECPAGTQRDQVLEVVSEMHKWELPALHILVTGRDYPDIREPLQCLEHRQEVTAMGDEVAKDISLHVSRRLDTDFRLRRWHGHRERITKHLAEHAHGVFRWVDCQLDTLQRCPQSPWHLEQCLESLPRTLDETYERILSEIDSAFQTEARPLLMLLCCSARPLRVEEVIDAVAVDIHITKTFDKKRRLHDADDLHRICPGLLELSTGDLPVFRLGHWGQPESRIVRIAHFSVQEYLRSSRIWLGKAAFYGISAKSDNTDLANLCLIYLSNEELHAATSGNELHETYPFTSYATEFWNGHYHQCNRKTKEELDVLIYPMLMNRALLASWIATHQTLPMRKNYPPEIEVMDTESPLHWAASCGLTNICERLLLLDSHSVHYTRGERVAVFQAAVQNQNEALVNLLLRHGVDINAKGGIFGNAVTLAVAIRSKKMLNLLLQNGADINADHNSTFSAVALATGAYNTEFIQLLLDGGADINRCGSNGQTALFMAIDREDESLVEWILNRGADVNAAHGRWGSALCIAARRGLVQIVEILIQHGANVNLHWNPFPRPAVDGRYYEVYESGGFTDCDSILMATLDSNNKRNAVPSRRHPPQFFDIIRLLLEHGADPNYTSDGYGSPLSYALRHKMDDAVDLLLEHGADVGALCPELNGRSPFQFVTTPEYEGGRAMEVQRKHLESLRSWRAGFQASSNSSHEIIRSRSLDSLLGAFSFVPEM